MNETDSIIEPAPIVAARTCYRRASSPRPIDLRLDANEGGAFASEILGGADLDAASVHRYPDAGQLEALFAARLGIAPDQLVVTAGADDALERVCRAVLTAGRAAAYCAPTFEMIPRYIRSCGATAVEVPWLGGQFPVDALIEAAADATVIFIVSPNNPTGGHATQNDLTRIRRMLPRALIVLDAAYAEFADVDLTCATLAMPWTIVTRTMSKAWGAAGLRVGYAAGEAGVIRWLRAVGQPYAVSNVSLSLAQRLLQRCKSASRAFVDRVKLERVHLADLLGSLGAEPLESQANFVLARFSNARLVADLLEGLGIAVRRFAPESMLADMLRIGCPGEPASFDRLCRALETALRPQAVLFDLDGVLADVRGSYREAIRLTCAEFGVSCCPADIAAMKAAGDANNDWILTQRLLANIGVEVSLDRVRGTFERFYQGTVERAGLWQTESPLCARRFLESLRSHFRLAIVTGRPREDADRFLRQHNLDGLFDSIVCMHDAAAKPDPAPVRLALRQLGVTRAWMLGDTPDDVRAARAAGVIPIGCIAPGDGSSAAELLLAAGAARVLDRVDQLAEILP